MALNFEWIEISKVDGEILPEGELVVRASDGAVRRWKLREGTGADVVIDISDALE